ncbi:hypothetical protein HWV62_19699 [Athelia sp. TMB]|nr:hypothetical protein HWV62_19699 [Athelia sp. TMB]
MRRADDVDDGTDRQRDTADLGYHLGARVPDDDHSGDGDYIDHLQQPGNTKKRKVPANAGISSHGGHETSVGLLREDDESSGTAERGSALGADREGGNHLLASGSPYTANGIGPMSLRRTGSWSRATAIGLQHKEMLRQRKRQLAAVLGAISHGDTLALDQALTSTYPITSVGTAPNLHQLRVRLSRRKAFKIARRAKSFVQVNLNTPFPFPTTFSFVCHSPTSERLVAVKEEVGLLRTRFQAELIRQANKAAEAAAAARKAALAATAASRNKSTRTQQRSRVSGREERSDLLDQNLLGGGAKSRSKKTKRSALAIASNPHHRRNYVPSRLPQSGQANPAQAAANALNYLGPPPFRFLSAEIPPSRKSRKNGKGTATPTAQLTNPTDEWICSLCEYKLFYGGDAEYRRAIRGRKKILRRRRRAERRAANVTAKMPAAGQDQDQDAYDDYETGFSGSAEYAGGGGKGRGEGVKGERGGDHIHAHG